MQTQNAGGSRPPITLIDVEADVLADLAFATRQKSPFVADLLMQEIDRAATARLSDMPEDLVTMMSNVVFVDEGSGERHSMQLVYPKDADTDLGRVSVLTPIGAALIGMRCGESIEWIDQRGTCRRLQVVEVKQPCRGG